MAELISPSIIPTDKLVANTQIRGAFTLILIAASLASHFVNLKITHVLLVGALLWTTAITMIDLYKLFTLSIFTATTASTIYLILRLVIFIFLVILIRDLGVYLKALQRQG